MSNPERKPSIDANALGIQGDSVRSTWAQAADADEPRKSIRRDPPPRPPELEPTGDCLLVRLGEELDYARRLLDHMGNQLSSDPALISRHLKTLQTIDIVGQLIGHVRTVIRSADRDAAVDRIGMAELKARLTRRSIG